MCHPLHTNVLVYFISLKNQKVIGQVHVHYETIRPFELNQACLFMLEFNHNHYDHGSYGCYSYRIHRLIYQNNLSVFGIGF